MTAHRFTAADPELSRKKEIILQLGVATPVGEILEFQTMTERLNEPVTSQHAAVRVLFTKGKDLGMHFQSVPGKGYRRMSDPETAIVGTAKHRQKLRRSAKRAIRTTSNVDRQKLNREERMHLVVNESLFRMIATNAHGNATNAQVRKQLASEPSALERTMARMRTEKG